VATERHAPNDATGSGAAVQRTMSDVPDMALFEMAPPDRFRDRWHEAADDAIEGHSRHD
jgi:hypothetical protein